MKLTILFILAFNFSTSYAYDANVNQFLKNNPWATDSYADENACTNFYENLDLRALYTTYCKIYSDQTKTTNAILICADGHGLPLANTFHQTKEKCEGK